MATKTDMINQRIDSHASQSGYGSKRDKGLEIYAARLFGREEIVRSAVLAGDHWEDADVSPFLCGNSGDGNFDAILYSGESDQIIAIQAKYRAKKWQEAELISEVDKLRGAFDHLKDRNYRHSRLSERALELVEDSGIHRKRKSVSLYLVTNQPVGDLRNAINRCVEISKEYDARSDDVSIEIYGAAELLGLEEAFEAAESGRNVVSQIIKFGDKTFEYVTESRRAVVGVLKGNAVSDLFKEQKDALFNLNVRGYLGGNSINKGIIATAEGEDAENFFYFNNGITATCSVLTQVSRGVFEAQDLQVVNGAQTVRSLHRALSSKPNNKVSVLFRLIETGETNRNKSKFANQIARFQNTQNKVLDSDFFANDKIQVWLEDNFSKQWSGKGEKNFVAQFHYVRKRGAKKSLPGKEISIQEMGKLRHSFLHGPKVAYREARIIWSADDNSRYLEAFGRKNEDGEFVAVDSWSDAELAEMAWAVHTWVYVQEEAKKLAKDRKDGNLSAGQSSDTSSDTARVVPEENYLRNLSFWVVAATAVGIREAISNGAIESFQRVMRSEDAWRDATADLLWEARIILAREITKLYNEGQANPRLNLPGNDSIWKATVAEMKMRGKRKVV
jgi:hypothetical protein